LQNLFQKSQIKEVSLQKCSQVQVHLLQGGFGRRARLEETHEERAQAGNAPK